MSSRQKTSCWRSITLGYLLLISACAPATEIRVITPAVTATITATITETPFPTSTASPQPTPTPEVKQFQDNDVENWKSCHIDPKDLVAYADFRREQLIEQGLVLQEPDPMNILPIDFAGPDDAFIYVKYDGTKASIDERPYFTGDRFCYTEADVISDTGQRRATFAVTTVAFPIPGKPGEFVVNAVLIEQFNAESDEDFKVRLRGYLNDWSIFGIPGGSTGRVEPISTQNEAAFPDLSAAVDQFIYNIGDDVESTMDPTSIDGIVLEAVPLWLP